MSICKVCGRKIRFYDKERCDYCGDYVHGTHCCISNTSFDKLIPYWASKEIQSRLPISRVRVWDHEEWGYNGPLCHNCRTELSSKIKVTIKEIKDKEIQYAKEEERDERYEYAISIYEKFNLELKYSNNPKNKEFLDDVLRCKRKIAKNYEIALKNEDAIKIYEKYEMWEDAGRCRRELQQQKSPQTRIDIGAIDHSTRTNISDSVIQRSSIGIKWEKEMTICPYCGEELNFPEPPRFCPYCRKQILILK